MSLPPALVRAGLAAAESGALPTPALRWAIRRLCAGMREDTVDPDELARTMRQGPVAPAPDEANEQHYEVPPELFRLALGPRLKYSSAWWGPGTTTLEQAEEDALRLSAEHAGIEDGMRVLELGCGWGSLTLWMAEHFPGSRFTAVTNSTAQAPFLRERARERGLANVQVVVGNVQAVDPGGPFDRVVSVEMFEHLLNWERLLSRIAGWLAPDGRLFVHVFRHRSRPHVYRTDGAADWMGRHFFTGGIMPSTDLLPRFDRDLRVAERWDWDGTHYARTAAAWRENLERRRAEVLPVLAGHYGKESATTWYHRWRIFFLACEELFGYSNGTEWGVSHYRLEPRPVASPAAGGRAA